jgi:cyclomaltodextrinase / maltogenic alpha-amylase / neopullulanase
MKLGKYQHFKGNIYEVIGVARHSETLEELVVYRALYKHKIYGENSLWVRPKKMFLENVVVDGKEIPRFALVEK